MSICRDVFSSWIVSWIPMKSSFSARIVESGETVYCSRAVKPPLASSNAGCRVLSSRGSMGCSFWEANGSEVDWGMVPRRRNDGTRRSSAAVLVRAQKSRFSKKYSRSPQDKIAMLVKTVCSTNEGVGKTLDEQGGWMKPPDWFNVLDGIGRRRRWLLALEVFRWIQVQKWYKADNGYYSKLISIMGKGRQYRMAMTMFKEMKRIGCRPDTSLYNSVMSLFLRSEEGKEKGFLKALALLEEMKLIRRCQPNTVTYNILIRAAAQMGDQEKVEALFKEIAVRRLSPDCYTFNGVIDAYGKEGNIVMMEAMFKRMRGEEKLKPDFVTFNTLIDAYGKAGEFEKMEQVFWSMTLRRTPPVLPAVKTFNSIITNYGNAGLVEKFESVFMEMRKVNVAPNLVTYEALIGAYGQCGRFEEMRNCLKKMDSRAGLTPQSSTLNKMLDKYCSHGMTAEAEDLLRNSLEQCGVEANSLSYAIVIRAHKKAGNRSQVEALLDDMKLVGVKPTKETYLDCLELFGIEMDYNDRQSDESAGTVRDLDELSSLSVGNDAVEGMLSSVEDVVGAAA